MPSYPRTSDRQVEWFHALAEEVRRNPTSLSSRDKTWLKRFVEQHLPGHALPIQLSDEEVVAAIVKLRDNETGWNRALQAAIIDADDQSQNAGPQQARTVLNKFAKDCPWKNLARIAIDQASNYS